MRSLAFLPAVGIILGIAVSAANAQKMYWGESGAGKIRRANLDGTNVEDLISGLVFPAIAIDEGARKMYWTTGADIFQIHRANLDGSNAELVLESFFGPSIGLALDVGAGKMYFSFESDAGCGGLRRANVDGSEIEDLPLMVCASGALALDLSNGKVYTSLPQIRRANLDGTNVELIVAVRSFGIAVDSGASKIYYTNHPAGAIERANLDGSEVEQLVTGLAQPSGIALDLVAGKMYWTDLEIDAIQRANLDGTEVENVISLGPPGPSRIALYLRVGEPVPTTSEWAVVVTTVLLVAGLAINLSRRPATRVLAGPAPRAGVVHIRSSSQREIAP